MKVEEEGASFLGVVGTGGSRTTKFCSAHSVIHRTPSSVTTIITTFLSRSTSARAAGDTGLKAVFSATSQLAVAARKRSGPSRKPTLVQSQMVPVKENRVLIRIVRIRASPLPPCRPLILPPSLPLAPSVPAPKLVRPCRSQIINL
ncbi:Uncharacterized protein Fot_37235 [Forsythia ovata]|uniref:Uncharacterized protein n=1 Tax=Forsythia ovata TaxID=205694 RepID=A0ABD1SRP4_9LAMI